MKLEIVIEKIREAVTEREEGESFSYDKKRLMKESQ
jgi:hypothetical protein